MSNYITSKIKDISDKVQVIDFPETVNYGILTKDNYFLLGKQPRLGEVIVNLLGGKVDQGETPEEALYREIKEETNLDKSDIYKKTVVYEKQLVTPGYSTELNSLYLITLNKTAEEIKDKIKCNDLEEGIELELIKYDSAELNKMSKTIRFDYLNNVILTRAIIDDFAKALVTPLKFGFGKAIELLKEGKSLRRSGWNGKGMFVYYVPGGKYPAQTEVAKEELADQDGLVTYNPYLAIKCVDGKVSTWVASINDLLAEDWELA